MEDVSALITPEKINAFENSQAARDKVIFLGQLCGAHNIEITQSRYTLVRDYLLAQIIIDNVLNLVLLITPDLLLSLLFAQITV